MATTISAPTYSKSGAKAETTTKLDASVFAVMPENHELIKLAYISYLANGRVNLAKTKTRGLVSGGGIKPWRQKGTGRARFGSIRDPQWRHGGIVFGPTGNENYTKKMSVASKRLALKQVLSLAASEGRVKVIEEFSNKDGKVARTAELLGKINATGTVLLVLATKDAMVERATGNMAGLKVVQANYLNVFDVMNSSTIVMTAEAVKIVHEWLGGKDNG